MLAVTSPVVLIAMLAVRATSPGPAIFSQLRVGRGGAVFA
ncbi:MAG: sugar transferase, partial [Mesorhizobium sp.]